MAAGTQNNVHVGQEPKQFQVKVNMIENEDVVFNNMELNRQLCFGCYQSPANARL